MEIFEKLNHNPNLSICLGFFDGVHQGHKVVLKNTVNLAAQNNLKSFDCLKLSINLNLDFDIS